MSTEVKDASDEELAKAMYNALQASDTGAYIGLDFASERLTIDGKFNLIEVAQMVKAALAKEAKP